MPALPVADPAPADGQLPPETQRDVAQRPFGVYLHVPFCATRCGYCDFNTYTAGELGTSTSPESYVEAALAELRLMRDVLARDGAAVRPASTVFVGGGTPTLLPAADLARLLQGVRDTVGLADGAEVTTEANPESVDERSLAALRAAGFTRISLGMQSAAPHVLRALDRRHRPGRPEQAAREAAAAGFEHISLDLIYGADGETDDDWARTLQAALAAPVDHVSAYALVVEDGTALARRVARGELAAPDDDVLADRWLIADDLLTAAGMGWYEVSSWARGAAAECRHNRLYWSGGDWWGIGPGAHSAVGGDAGRVRWWNVKHPAAYGARLAAALSPAAGREVLDAPTRALERVLLGVRVREGLPTAALPGTEALAGLVTDGLVQADWRRTQRVVLTRRGRLLADAVVRALT